MSLATRSRTPVPTQHGTASHNRWKGITEEREKERHSGRRGREENERRRKRDRQIDGGRDPPLDPESANSNITIRPPRSKRRRTSRLPPSSYVFSSLALSLSSPFYSTYLFLARFYLPRTPAPNLSRLSLRRPAFSALLFFPCHPQPPPFQRRCRRCISALTSAKLEARPARKRRRQTRFLSAPMKWRTTEHSLPWRISSEKSSRSRSLARWRFSSESDSFYSA